jgi:hypothetical protein
MTTNDLIEGTAWRGLRLRKLKSISDEQLSLLANSQWRAPRMLIVPVRITSDLLTRIRARGIPVSQFLREAGEKALDDTLTEQHK